MRETDTQIEVQNPSVIAGITPMAAIYPSVFMYIGRNISAPARYWTEGLLMAVMVIFFVFAILAGIKKVSLALQADGMQFLKKRVEVGQIEQISYNQRTRYLRVKTRPAIRSFNVYLGKKEEVPAKLAVLEEWATQTGLMLKTY